MRQVRAFAFCECGIDVTADSDDLLARACRAPFVRAGRPTPSLAIAANGQSLELRSVPPKQACPPPPVRDIAAMSSDSSSSSSGSEESPY